MTYKVHVGRDTTLDQIITKLEDQGLSSDQAVLVAPQMQAAYTPFMRFEESRRPHYSPEFLAQLEKELNS